MKNLLKKMHTINVTLWDFYTKNKKIKKTRIVDLQTHAIQKKSFSKYKTEKPKTIQLMFQTFLKNK